MKKISLIMLLLCGISFASELSSLLDTYTDKNNLTKKTVDENKGHLVLFSRDKLEKMHAKTLKDIFKTTPVIYYHENRYALPDPLSGGTFSPYRSNFIRLYIDGVEITQGWAGSGIMLYGDMNIDFADHIEFYYMTPSFETSTEPAYLTIFVYSKDPSRDSGTKLSLAHTDNGSNSQTISHSDVTDEYSYMINLSHTDSKRDKIDNDTDTPLSRDFERTQLFAYVKDENQAFHLQILKKDTDSLAGLSWDATPITSKEDYLNLHMDYSIDFNEHWNAKLAYEWLKTDMEHRDDTPLVDIGLPYTSNTLVATTKASTYSGELTYTNQIEEHRITSGVKARIKKLDSTKVNDVDIDMNTVFDTEIISSLFLQDQYRLSKQELLTFGIEYTRVDRNHGLDDNDLLQLRLGYIYTDEHWSYKAYLYRSMFSRDPLSIHIGSTNHDFTPQSTTGTTQEIAYKNKNHRIRLMLLAMKDKNGLLQNEDSGNTKYFFSVLNYDYTFNSNHEMNLMLYYARYEDIFNLDKLEDWSGYLSFSNTYGDFDLYNGVVWHQNSIDNENYFDLTSAITWNASESLSFTLKGQNLLDKAKKTNLFRLDPTTMTPMAPLEISPVDRRVTLEMEYTF